MTSPLVHFVGLLSGTAPFNKTATPIDTLPETDQVRHTLTGHDFPQVVMAISDPAVICWPQEIWAWLDQRQSGGVVYIAFGTEVGGWVLLSPLPPPACDRCLTQHLWVCTQAFPSHEEFSKILSGVRSFCTKHNASALLALRPNLRKHLTEAVIGASAVGGDIRVVDWVTQVWS
jgi:hypothetical protein